MHHRQCNHGREHLVSNSRKGHSTPLTSSADDSCWPVFGPRIREDLGLSLTETNAIWSAAVVGQYASSVLMGSISDAYGPRPLSLLAALLFGGGYFLMAQTERSYSGSHRESFIAMAMFFVLVGAGVAAR